MHVHELRRDFPILDTGIAYLDNAASSLTPEPILDRMTGFYHEYRANVERFGIPEEYVRQAFSIEALTAAVKDRKQLFLVAVEGGRLIGFAQTIRDAKGEAELDRIFLTPSPADQFHGSL
jgi:hypothetical protein